MKVALSQLHLGVKSFAVDQLDLDVAAGSEQVFPEELLVDPKKIVLLSFENYENYFI